MHFGVDYPEVERTRLTVAFRLVLAIPALIVLGVVNTARALLYRPPLLLILCWFDWKPAASADSRTGCSCSGTSTADQRGTGNIAVAVVAIIGWFVMLISGQPPPWLPFPAGTPTRQRGSLLGAGRRGGRPTTRTGTRKVLS